MSTTVDTLETLRSIRPANETEVGNVEAADYNARILKPLAEWLRDVHGAEKLERVARGSSIPITHLDGRNHWISLEQFESFVAAVRELCADDAAFRAACVHRLDEGYGAIRYVLWAASPGAVYGQAVRTYKLMSSIGEPTILESSRTTLSIRFGKGRPISRLNCLLRQAQSAQLPTLWGLPPAVVRETSCVAKGDECCEYHMRWYDQKRWMPIIAGVALGVLSVYLLVHYGLANLAATIALPILGGLIGFASEQSRTAKSNLEVGQEANDALRQLAEEEADARREILALHARQRAWTRMLEADAAERAATIQNVVSQMERSQEARDRRLRGFSHDLRSPLTILRAGAEYLALHADRMGEEAPQVIEEFEQSLDRMQRLLTELMQVATAQAGIGQLAPEPLEVSTLTERLRRRLRAMVHGRDIRVSAFRTREAPERVEADPLLLDRITDNLLSNAAKYTERGSIVVEVDGSPGFLVLKVSDSGRGIEAEQMEQAFLPGGSDQKRRAAESYGLGLSVVVQLLDQIGGRLEVMSKPGVGTTFWVYMPVCFSPKLPESQPIDDLVQKVVTIRRIKSA